MLFLLVAEGRLGAEHKNGGVVARREFEVNEKGDSHSHRRLGDGENDDDETYLNENDDDDTEGDVSTLQSVSRHDSAIDSVSHFIPRTTVTMMMTIMTTMMMMTTTM